MNEDLSKNIQKLGESETQYKYEKPDPSLLEKFPNPFSIKEMNSNGVQGDIEIVCPEFTSLCPKTGQPDFATIRISYTPGDFCVESKSLKLYLVSYRNHGEFHEACVNRIANDLVNLLKPRKLEVVGEFTPRGGIPFWPKARYFAPQNDIVFGPVISPLKDWCTGTRTGRMESHKPNFSELSVAECKLLKRLRVEGSIIITGLRTHDLRILEKLRIHGFVKFTPGDANKGTVGEFSLSDNLDIG